MPTRLLAITGIHSVSTRPLLMLVPSKHHAIRRERSKLSRYKSITLVSMQLILLGLIAAGPAGAIPGICLVRNPAPPIAVPNDGAHSVTFNWTIEYNTTCNQPYRLEILDIGGNVIFQTTFPCAPSVINNGFSWLVPQGLACGCYYARLSFFSNWCQPCPTCFEDQATVSFLVSASATFKVCKFRDDNGNGIRDPGEPPISGWTFNVENCNGLVIATGTTNTDGCVTFTIPVACEGTTTVCIRDVLPPGWAQTTQGGVNPFQVVLSPGSNPDILVGNWQPILICGFKFLDQAPWPWTNPHFVGPQGQENPPSLEPVPPCPQPFPPPGPCSSPFQEDAALGISPVGIPGVTVRLYDGMGNLLQTRVTDQNGAFCFGPIQWRQDFRIVMDNPPPAPAECQPPLDGTNLQPWPGEYVGTVATSPWPCRIVNFPPLEHQLDITLPVPVQVNQVFGCNYFFNRQPSRLFGLFCPEAAAILGATPNLGVQKDGLPYITPAVNADPVTGFYEVPSIPVEPQGLRPGTFTLTLPALPNPLEQAWQVTTYCDSIHGNSTFVVPSGGSVDIGVPHSADVRVDFCITQEENKRRCFMPVTFTQQGWHDFCDPTNPIIPGGMVYNRFRLAFANYTFFGTPFQNKVIIGQGDKTITFEGTTSGLNRLCAFLPQTGPGGKLDRSYINPTTTPAGALAGELLALQMNIAYNDQRLMPRTSGYDLEKFRLADSVFKGKTVGQVRDIANAVLAGALPSSFGLPNPPAVGYAELVNILAKINANYEFVNFDIFNDRGFLIPNRPFGLPDPPTPVVVPTP